MGEEYPFEPWGGNDRRQILERGGENGAHLSRLVVSKTTIQKTQCRAEGKREGGAGTIMASK